MRGEQEYIYLVIFLGSVRPYSYSRTSSSATSALINYAQFVFRWEVYHDWGNSSSNDVEENRRKSRTYVN